MPQTNRAQLCACCIMLASTSMTRADNAQEQLFQQRCQGCHTIAMDGDPRQGPNLWGILGREVGSVPDFEYSSTLQATTQVWSEDLMNTWLEDPKGLFPGTYMFSKFTDGSERAEIIDFLKSRSPTQEASDG